MRQGWIWLQAIGLPGARGHRSGGDSWRYRKSRKNPTVWASRPSLRAFPSHLVSGGLSGSLDGGKRRADNVLLGPVHPLAQGAPAGALPVQVVGDERDTLSGRLSVRVPGMELAQGACSPSSLVWQGAVRRPNAGIPPASSSGQTLGSTRLTTRPKPTTALAGDVHRPRVVGWPPGVFWSFPRVRTKERGSDQPRRFITSLVWAGCRCVLSSLTTGRSGQALSRFSVD